MLLAELRQRGPHVAGGRHLSCEGGPVRCEGYCARALPFTRMWGRAVPVQCEQASSCRPTRSTTSSLRCGVSPMLGIAVDDTAWASLVPAARFEAKRSRAEELVPEVHVRGHVPTTGSSSTPGQAASGAHCSPAPISPATSSASISSISLRTLRKGGRAKEGGHGLFAAASPFISSSPFILAPTGNGRDAPKHGAKAGNAGPFARSTDYRDAETSSERREHGAAHTSGRLSVHIRCNGWLRMIPWTAKAHRAHSLDP